MFFNKLLEKRVILAIVISIALSLLNIIVIDTTVRSVTVTGEAMDPQKVYEKNKGIIYSLDELEATGERLKAEHKQRVKDLREKKKEDMSKSIWEYFKNDGGILILCIWFITPFIFKKKDAYVLILLVAPLAFLIFGFFSLIEFMLIVLFFLFGAGFNRIFTIKRIEIL